MRWTVVAARSARRSMVRRRPDTTAVVVRSRLPVYARRFHGGGGGGGGCDDGDKTARTRSTRRQPPAPHAESACWSCEHYLAEEDSPLFCGSCDALQPPERALSRNYFELFDVRQEFALDLRRLERQYRRMQGLVHPDRFAREGTSEREQRYSHRHSSLLATAYSTLRDPHSRMVYLLQLHGIDAEDERETDFDPAMMMELMELHEDLEMAAERGDIQRVAQLDETLEGALHDVYARVWDALASGDRSGARTLMARMQFLGRVRRRARELHDPNPNAGVVEPPVP